MSTTLKPERPKVALVKNNKDNNAAKPPAWYIKALSTQKCEYCGLSHDLHKSSCKVFKMILTGNS